MAIGPDVSSAHRDHLSGTTLAALANLDHNPRHSRLLMLTRQAAAALQRPNANGTMSPRRIFDGYPTHPTAWDEWFTAPGMPHGHCHALAERLGQFTLEEFQQRRAGADLVFTNQGITFSVYADQRGVEKIFPFDLIPRPIAPADAHMIPIAPGRGKP